MTFKAVDRRCASSVASNQPACLSLSALKKQAGEHEAGGRAAVLHHEPSLPSFSPLRSLCPPKSNATREGGEPEMDIGVATNGHYVFSLGTLTRSPARSLAACLVARPARSGLHRYIVTYTPRRRRGTTGRRRSHWPPSSSRALTHRSREGQEYGSQVVGSHRTFETPLS